MTEVSMIYNSWVLSTSAGQSLTIQGSGITTKWAGKNECMSWWLGRSAVEVWLSNFFTFCICNILSFQILLFKFLILHHSTVLLWVVARKTMLRHSTTTDDMCFATFGGFHEMCPDIVKCLNVWPQVGNPVWEGFRRHGLSRRNMSPRVGFEVSKAMHQSFLVCFPVLPIGYSRYVCSHLFLPPCLMLATTLPWCDGDVLLTLWNYNTK